jgi:hypothetical protein
MTLKAYSVLLSTMTSVVSQMVVKFRRGLLVTKILKAIAPVARISTWRIFDLTRK